MSFHYNPQRVLNPLRVSDIKSIKVVLIRKTKGKLVSKVVVGTGRDLPSFEHHGIYFFTIAAIASSRIFSSPSV
jgi:hypothetical protein